jgi:REP element-mobilizing transposase RayT
MGHRRKRHSPNWGGARPGAGRKPKGERALVSHKVRARFAMRTALHLVLRVAVRAQLASAKVRGALVEALRGGRERHGLHVIAFGRRADQVHLLVEADGSPSLSRGMQGLSIRIAKGINRVIGSRGTMFTDHFEAFVLRTPEELRAARSPIRWEQPRGVVSEPRLRLLRG